MTIEIVAEVVVAEEVEDHMESPAYSQLERALSMPERKTRIAVAAAEVVHREPERDVVAVDSIAAFVKPEAAHCSHRSSPEVAVVDNNDDSAGCESRGT